MMKPSFLNRENIPFLYLVMISLWWSFYYQTNSSLNDFGNANFEYLYLIDGLLVLPILCLWLIKDKKSAILKAIVYSCSVIFIAGLIVPVNEQVFIQHFELIRYVALLALVILEIIAVATVVLAVKSSLSNNSDPDESITQPIKNIFGEGLLANVISFETRIWTYVLFSRFVKKTNFLGQYHFDYHEKDGAKVNSLGFVFLILFELPLVHLLLHFIWSPIAASIISLLTAFGLMFLLAEYRALGLRPVSIFEEKLVIRYGVWNAYEIDLNDIEFIGLNEKEIRRSKTIKKYNYFGVPNVIIKLRNCSYEEVYLGLDSPHEFIEKVRKLQNPCLNLMSVEGRGCVKTE